VDYRSITCSCNVQPSHIHTWLLDEFLQSVTASSSCLRRSRHTLHAPCRVRCGRYDWVNDRCNKHCLSAARARKHMLCECACVCVCVRVYVYVCVCACVCVTLLERRFCQCARACVAMSLTSASIDLLCRHCHISSLLNPGFRCCIAAFSSEKLATSTSSSRQVSVQ
jgi:hypothetical protein